MSDINNIDDLFKGKLQGRQVAYSAAAWQGAEGLLSKHYKALLLKKILLITIPTLIAGAIGLTVLFNSGQKVGQSPQGNDAVVGTSFIEQEENSESSEIASTEETTESYSSGNESIIHEEQIAESEANVTTLKTSQSAASKEPLSTNSAIEIASVVDQPAEEIEESTTDPSVPLPPGFNDFLDGITLDESSADNTSALTDELEENNMPIEEANALLNSINSDMGSMPSFDVSQISNWSTGLADADRASEKLMSKIRKLELMASGGGLISTGMRGNGWQNEKASLGWHAGITVQYFIKEKWFAQTGATVHQRSAINSRRLEWPPYYILPTDVNAPINLRYIDIPIQMGYRLGGRHEVAFGLAFAPLLNYTRTTNVIGSHEVVEYEKEGSSREGFANFDVAALLNYKYQVTERIDVKVEGRFGAFDVTDNAYFGTGIVDDRNHQVRLGLSYRIIRR